MSDKTDEYRVTPDRLHRRCDPAELGFDTTAELEPLDHALGQEEAFSALAFGLALRRPGYNLFILGAPGSGRHSSARRALEAVARDEQTPPDWCYVTDFDDHRRPRALGLPSGRGPELASAISELVEDLRSAIPEALQSEQVQARRSSLAEHAGKAATELMDRLRQELTDDPKVALIGDPGSVTVVGARGGEPLSRRAFQDLPDEMRHEIEERVISATSQLFDVQRRIQAIRREAQEEVRHLHQEVAKQVVQHRVAEIRSQFEDVPEVVEHIDRVEKDIVEHALEFAPREEPEVLAHVLGADSSAFFRRYEVNVLVTREPDSGAPVVEEPHPHLRNLMGRIEGEMRFGVIVTEFARICPGAIHRALGGYLLLDAEEVLTRPLVWPTLKRALATGEVVPADPSSEVGLLPTPSLQPAPIPTVLTVILVGTPRIYYRLKALDPDFDELFKVKVDFAPDLTRTTDSERAYGRFVAAACERHDLPPFDAEAVARLVEESGRLAGDQTKLTTQHRPMVDLIVEAAHHAREADGSGGALVRAADIDAAIAARDARNGRPKRRLLELIERGILRFQPAGEAIGQVYGIGLISIGDDAFGRPIRLSASAYLGSGGVIAIEREVEMAGRIHNKGVLVLTGYLGEKFAQKRPLILTASLSFEQMYEEVEGDSASAAELYVLMSQIGQIPVTQTVAVTGALSEEGDILPVGGVTEKIEGFYEACERVGLDGTQGVIFPRRNLDSLVLRRPVRDSVEAGRFSLWAIDRVEEGWPILSGLEAGERGADGAFPEGTAHRAVDERLAAWANLWSRSGGGAGEAVPDEPAGVVPVSPDGPPANDELPTPEEIEP